MRYPLLSVNTVMGDRQSVKMILDQEVVGLEDALSEGHERVVIV